MTRRRFISLISGLVAAAALTACGKKGKPKPPDPEKSTFPTQYPKPE